MKILARCPANCHRSQGQVYGTGIHPDNSPICLSALVDKAVSEYGGIISISIFPGLEKYLVNKFASPSNLIKVSNFIGHAGKSYVVSKVDNLDIIEKDIRIVDSKGNLGHMGRLEVRLNGRWGTICTLRNNNESARRICKDLGYKDGKWLTKAGSVLCQNYNGQNFCGSENYKSLFSDINCSLKDTSFSYCSKKEANKNECTHANDALISCSNTSFESADLIPNGTLKLENAKIYEGLTIGRLEYYSNTRYLPVCSNGFSPESANVACKQMGFESGEKFNDDGQKFTYPADDSTGFAVTQVKCVGDENSLSECNSQTSNIECSHNLDVVLQCSGPKGDPSGKSQIKSSGNQEVAPSLGKLSLLKFKISCDTKGNDQKFRGDAGSVYIVSCPANCSKEKGTLWGLGLYTLDSNVCQAGIHAGVISDEKGGSFAYTKIWGQNYYIGLFKNGIASSELNSAFPVSFTVQALNSGWNGMWKLWKENYGGVYLEEESKIEIVSKKDSRITIERNNRSKYQPRAKKGNFRKTQIKSEDEKISSFIETTMTLQSSFNPIFEWIEIDPSHIFSDKSDGSVVLNENSMRPLKKYQILMRIKMTDFKGKKSFIFSNGGCNNFNVYIDESDNLIFGDPCNEAQQINTNIQMALNDKTIVYAFYEDSHLKVVIFSEKLSKPISKIYTKTLNINNTSPIGIGRKSDVKDMFFYGYIDFIQIYDEEIPFLRLNDIIDGINNKAKLPVSLEARNTIDKRACISSCVNDPTPGHAGAPSPPRDADPCIYFFLKTIYF
jgi:LCCL domain/Scavenger receptor cysteine-rich domain